jgi:hypothetical protein
MSLNLTAPCELNLIVNRRGASLLPERYDPSASHRSPIWRIFRNSMP